MLGAHAAAVLAGAVRVGFDLPGAHLVGIELQDLSVVLIDQYNAMETRHEESTFDGDTNEGSVGFGCNRIRIAGHGFDADQATVTARGIK